MRMRMIPPAAAQCLAGNDRASRPARHPPAEIRAVVMPMRHTSAPTDCLPRQANETPTSYASMLVAKARSVS